MVEAGYASTGTMRERRPRALDLALAGLAAQLPGQFDELGRPRRADRMAFAQQSAARVQLSTHRLKMALSGVDASALSTPIVISQTPIINGTTRNVRTTAASTVATPARRKDFCWCVSIMAIRPCERRNSEFGKRTFPRRNLEHVTARCARFA